MGCESSKYVGRDVVLEYAIGCGDALPIPADWKLFSSMRTKEFNLTWDTIDATDGDSVGALRENLATFLSLAISGGGLCRTGPQAASLSELTQHFVNPVATNGQPLVWLRMTFPDLTFTCFMLLSTLSRGAPYDDMVTYTMEASATASDFGLIVADTVPKPNPTSVTVTPATAAISTLKGTTTLIASVLPAGADQRVTWVSSDVTLATVGPTGIVTAVKNGSPVITAVSVANPTKSASSTITITSNP